MRQTYLDPLCRQYFRRNTMKTIYATLLGGLYKDLQVVGDRTLAREFPELTGPKHLLQLLIGGGALFTARIEVFGHGWSYKSS